LAFSALLFDFWVDSRYHANTGRKISRVSGEHTP
jgi:hypothetical protein